MSNVKETKELTIVGCFDPMMWYRDLVGEKVDFVKEDDDYYWCREPEGYINIVHKSDGIINE